MKRLFFIMAAFIIAATSCEDNNEFYPSSPVEEMEWGKVSFSLGTESIGPDTRSSSQASESAIKSLQILVFNSSGNLVSYGKGNISMLSVTVPIGVAGHTVYALVNVSDDLSSCKTKKELTDKVSYLKDNSSEGLQMIGSETNVTFSSGTPVEMIVTRFASRVEIDQITTAFTATSHKSMAFTVSGIFLINVNGTCPYTAVSTAGTWYNQLKMVSGDCDALISDVFSKPDTIQTAKGAVTPYSKKHYFYCYSNPTDKDVHGGTFSARRTRLVVEAKLDTVKYYYPIDIVGTGNTLERNTSYTITKLTITGPGVPNPDDELKTGSVYFSVNVDKWKTGFSKEVNY